uniref:Integrin beta-like protein C isoform X1 n=1 Tax=Crassostrea virginica TaxID=6565 RepID=A0A8B8AY82_CRAVI|nr:integrin beta-like protein C isoform X1 [Crassostrea virginica]
MQTRSYAVSWVIHVCIILIMCARTNASHFRGGTISWKPTGRENEVQFSFKLGWTYNRGPGCTTEKVGQLVTNMNNSYWQCTSGCNSSLNIANVNYICTGASQSENWEQGEGTFTYKFPGIGPYTVEFTGSAWVTLSHGSPGSWSIGSVVYLGERNDTKQPNISPITTGKPVYRVPYGCQSEIVIPVVDADDDVVKCRWSTGSECVSICGALPNATIDSNTCTIRLSATHTAEGTFAVAVTVQDFPQNNITIDNQVHLTTAPLSTVTLQFLVKTPVLTSNCENKPSFVSPTLPQASIIYTKVFQTVNLLFYASGNRSISSITMTTPAGMTYTSLQNDPMLNGTVFLNATWTPQQNQVGTHITCAIAEDVIGKTSDSRCITIIVKDSNECVDNPCQNNGTCTDGLCLCQPGYTDDKCQTDINECSPDPCNSIFECEDRINEYHCELIGWKLALIIVISLFVFLMVAIFIFYLKRK